MKIETLREFLTIVKCGGFNRAAKALYVSQPNLSARIAAMERELGFEVFDRARPRVALTAAGAAFIESAQVVVDAYDRGVARGKAAQGSPAPLRVAGVAAGTPQFTRLSALEGPAFEFVDSGSGMGFYEALLNGSADIEVCCARFDAEELHDADPEHDYRVEQAGFGAAAIAMSRGNPLAAKPSLARRDLEGATVSIGFCQMYDKWKDVVERMLGVEGLTYRLQHASSTSEVARLPLGDTLHVCGLGVTRMYYSGRDDVVTFCELDGEPLRFPMYVAWRACQSDARVEDLAARVARALRED